MSTGRNALDSLQLKVNRLLFPRKKKQLVFVKLQHQSFHGKPQTAVCSYAFACSHCRDFKFQQGVHCLVPPCCFSSSRSASLRSPKNRNNSSIRVIQQTRRRRIQKDTSCLQTRGIQREYSSKPKHSIVKRILVFKPQIQAYFYPLQIFHLFGFPS